MTEVVAVVAAEGAVVAAGAAVAAAAVVVAAADDAVVAPADAVVPAAVDAAARPPRPAHAADPAFAADGSTTAADHVLSLARPRSPGAPPAAGPSSAGVAGEPAGPADAVPVPVAAVDGAVGRPLAPPAAAAAYDAVGSPDAYLDAAVAWRPVEQRSAPDSHHSVGPCACHFAAVTAITLAAAGADAGADDGAADADSEPLCKRRRRAVG